MSAHHCPRVMTPRRIRALRARRRAPLLIVESRAPLTPERADGIRRVMSRVSLARVIIHGPDVSITPAVESRAPAVYDNDWPAP